MLDDASEIDKSVGSKKDMYIGFEKITGKSLRRASFKDIVKFFKCKDGFLPKLIQSECNDKGLQFLYPNDGCADFPGMFYNVQ